MKWGRIYLPSERFNIGGRVVFVKTVQETVQTHTYGTQYELLYNLFRAYPRRN